MVRMNEGTAVAANLGQEILPNSRSNWRQQYSSTLLTDEAEYNHNRYSSREHVQVRAMDLRVIFLSMC